MTKTQARSAMLQPRQIREAKHGHQKGWFYIEDDGLSVITRGTDGGAPVAVKLPWSQLQKAIAVHRTAGSATGAQ